MASDQGLQRIIAAALTDDDVRAALFTRPISLANRFRLTAPERRFLAGVRARDLEHFAALVEAWKANRMLGGNLPEDAPRNCISLARVLVYGDQPDRHGRQVLLPGPPDVEIARETDAGISRPGSIVAFLPATTEPLTPGDRFHLRGDGTLRAGRIVVLRQMRVRLDRQP